MDKALRQIDEKQYDAELLVKGIAGSPAVDDDNKIRSYWEMSWSRRMNACISRRVNISTEPEAVRSADDNQGQREKTS